MGEKDLTDLPDDFMDLSNLPDDIMYKILSFLPFKDAVKCSVLSRSWRGKWHNIDSIVINEETFNKQQKDEGILNHILTQHNANIKCCKLFVDEGTDEYNLQTWLTRLSQKQIEHLILQTKFARFTEIPATLFCCDRLKELTITRFTFNPLELQGFENLKYLRLSDTRIETKSFEAFIKSCPSLEQLSVQTSSRLHDLSIMAPRLSDLTFIGKFKSIEFNAPLKTLCFDIPYRRWNFLVTGLPESIEILTVRNHCAKFFESTGWLSGCYKNLGILTLNNLCLEKEDETSSLIKMIKRLPHLRVLNISMCNHHTESETNLKSWDTMEICFKELQYVRCSFNEGHATVKFVQLLLTGSALLKEIVLEYNDDESFMQSAISLVLNFPRASKEAEIKLLQMATKNQPMSISVDCDGIDGDRQPSNVANNSQVPIISSSSSSAAATLSVASSGPSA